MKKLLLIIIFTLFISTACFCNTIYEIKAPFAMQDLMKNNVYNKIAKFNFESEFGVFHKITGDFEVAYLVKIDDTEDPNIKICTFFYEENKYRPDIDVFSIESWIESLSNGDEVIKSLTDNNHITRIYEVENGEVKNVKDK